MWHKLLHLQLEPTEWKLQKEGHLYEMHFNYLIRLFDKE